MKRICFVVKYRSHKENMQNLDTTIKYTIKIHLPHRTNESIIVIMVMITVIESPWVYSALFSTYTHL